MFHLGAACMIHNVIVILIFKAIVYVYHNFTLAVPVHHLLLFPQLAVRYEARLEVLQMSRLTGKPTMWFPNRSDANRPVQLQKQARILKFRI